MTRPLVVLGGYLGAGKTTLLNRLLSRPDTPPTGVLVNDFGAINVDAALIRNRSGATLELANGCVCCSLAGDLGVALEALRGEPITQVIVEASGAAQPARIADYGRSAPGYRLGAVFTVVDAEALPELRRNRYVGSLVETQMEQADLLLVSKLDLLDEATRAARLAELPGPALAASREAERLLLEPDSVRAGRRAADAGRANLPADAQSLFRAVQISADVRLRRAAVERCLDDLPTGVARIKGWVSDEHGESWLLQLAGRRWSLEPAEAPDAGTPAAGTPAGGCRLVTIGFGDVPLEALRARLLACAVSPA